MSSLRVRSIGLSVLALAFGVSGVRADEPDLRDLPPFVMIVADTSGSMEWVPGCKCTTDGCTECLPKCELTNDASGEPPAGKKNRWAVVLEALTGKFKNFECDPIARTAANGMTYDVGYSKPYHQPWVCGTPGTMCPYPGTPSSPIQIDNGLLDNYSNRIRFGLATFDGMRTFAGKGDLVTAADFDANVTLSDTAPGSFSYGGGKLLRYPSCTEDYKIDSGIRGPNAPEGGLISLNWPGCTTPPCDMVAVNNHIQSTLLSTRTFGGTPIASALDDLYFHFAKEFNDSLSECRDRYAVLITDGYPDDDFRDYPSPGCDCKKFGNCGAKENPDDMKCPYPTAVEAALDLYQGRGGDGQQINKLFVVGMSIADGDAKARLNAVASSGGSPKNADGNEAFFAEDPASLTATLDTLLSTMTRPISRSVPAFATGLSGTQYQVSAGFGVSTITPPVGYSTPWMGILERRRFQCGTDGSLGSPDLTDEDKFHVQLNKTDSRTRELWTVVPPETTTSMDGVLDRGKPTSGCGTTGCKPVSLRTLTKEQLAVTTDPAKDEVIHWMFGDEGSLREKQKLGDIYHSSPTIVGPPVEDPGDQSYTLFRESALIDERPMVMYVNSNDGILHAFSLEAFPPTGKTLTVNTGKTLTAGQEMWGFVPPMLVNDLSAQLRSHKLNLDGTPVVKDVFFSKGTAPSATDYKTVLITGMRGGGAGYMALDVTDPFKPEFLWQFTDKYMGYTYGQAQIVQATYSWPKGEPAQVRAMAILPGGMGYRDSHGPGCDGGVAKSARVPNSSGTVYTTLSDPDSSSPTRLKHREAVQCWGAAGRSLYFVDIETGQLIKSIVWNENDPGKGMYFPSPVSGSPAAYQDAVGMLATEGFVLDADGVLWRIDINATDPKPDAPLDGWTIRPFHDLFWDGAADEGEPSYERPILSLDEYRRLVIIVGTGDTDNFEKRTAKNRVVSLTEITTTTPPSSPKDYEAAINWEQRVGTTDEHFVAGEIVTGSMSLFQGQLYAATFITAPDTTKPCLPGAGRLWSWDYRQRSKTENPVSGDAKTFAPMRLDVVSSDSSSANADLKLFNILKKDAEPNLLVLGLGTTQRATCDVSLSDNLTNYFAPKGLTAIQQSALPPAIWLVAQASGDNSARKRAGSSLGTMQVSLNRPLSFSRVASWAGSVE